MNRNNNLLLQNRKIDIIKLVFLLVILVVPVLCKSNILVEETIPCILQSSESCCIVNHHEIVIDILNPDNILIVEELTFAPVENKPKHILKKEYIRSFKNKSVSALVIKVADRICNVRDFMIYNPDYARTYYNKAAMLFDFLVDRKDEVNSYFLNDQTVDYILESKSFVDEFLRSC